MILNCPRIEPRWYGDNLPPKLSTSDLPHVHLCDDTGVPYGVWLFSFFLDSQLFPLRLQKCIDFNGYNSEIHQKEVYIHGNVTRLSDVECCRKLSS